MTEPLVVTRRIEAPPSKVYRYLTESESWALWQGVEVSLDPHPGGVISMAMPGGQMAQGKLVELVPDRRVVFSWGWVGHPEVPPASTTVEIDLAAEGSGTVVTLTHRGLPPEEVGIHRLGWEHYLPRLATASEGGDPGPDTGPG